MRTPKSPEPFTERQVTPGIQEGKFETHVPEGAFGGVSPKVEEAENKTVDLTTKIQEDADKYQVQQIKNHISDMNSQVMGEAQATKGEKAAQYNPSLAGGIYQKTQKDMSDYIDNSNFNNRVKKEGKEYLLSEDSANQRLLQKYFLQQHFVATVQGQTDGIQKEISKAPDKANDDATFFQGLKNIDEIHTQLEQTTGGAGKQESEKNHIFSRASYITNGINSLLNKGKIEDANRLIGELQEKKMIDTNTLQNLQLKVNDKKFGKDINDSWDGKYRYFKNSDGTSNREAILADALPKFPEDMRKVVTSRFETLCAQDDLNKRVKDNSNMNAFQQKVDSDFQTQMKKGKADADSLEKYIPQFSKGNAHEAQKMDNYIQSLFKQNGLTINLTNNAQQAQSKNMIQIRTDIALNNIQNEKQLEVFRKEVSPKEFRQLDNELFQIQTKGTDVQRGAIITRRAQDMGKDAFGNDPDAMNLYMSGVLDDLHHGVEPKDVLANAQKTLKDNGNSYVSKIWKYIGGQKNENPNQIQPENLRDFYVDYGKLETDGIRDYMRQDLKREPTIFEFSDFVESLGGSQALQRNMPASNSLRSLLKWNEDNSDKKPIPVTKQNIQKGVEIESNGIWY